MLEDVMVPVFEGQNLEDCERIKKILEKAGIQAETGESGMQFPRLPDKITPKVNVHILDEQKAFVVIDRYLSQKRA